MKQLFILRGLSGQGKSTIAKILSGGLKESRILSADDLRIVDGKYQFIPEYEPYIWDEFERIFLSALADGVENIIMDNTNLKPIHYYQYKEDAIESGYIVHEIIVGDFDVETSYKRGTHEVPIDKIQMMKDAFEFPIIDKCKCNQIEKQNDNWTKTFCSIFVNHPVTPWET